MVRGVKQYQVGRIMSNSIDTHYIIEAKLNL